MKDVEIKVEEGRLDGKDKEADKRCSEKKEGGRLEWKKDKRDKLGQKKEPD